MAFLNSTRYINIRFTVYPRVLKAISVLPQI